MKELIEPELLRTLESDTQVGKWKMYEEYKDSGAEWLGEIPKHWEVRKLKYSLLINSETLKENIDSDYTLQYIDISNVDSGGKIHNVQELTFKNAPSRARRKVRNGDTILSTVRTYLRAIGYINDPPENLIASTGFAVLRPHHDINPKFLYRYIQSQVFVSLVVSYSEGVGYPAINPSRLACLSLLLPPLKEQQTIAAFLNRETTKINDLITHKEHLIELLQERRTAIINQAVTRGLNPDVPMKDSGVDWLGEIPAHWKVRRLKFIANVLSGVAKGKDLKDKKIINLPYLRVANVQDGYLDLSDIHTITVSIEEFKQYLLKAGDVLMNEGGDFDKLGRGSIWNGSIDPCLHQNHVFAVRPLNVEDSRWISLITQANYAKYYFVIKSKQSTNLASISNSNIQNVPVLLPPAEERCLILAHIDQETAKIDKLISIIQEGIKKLQEYSAALISAAVTGKIDVRGEVANVQGEETAI